MQLTIRADDELVQRIRSTAAAEGRSMNEWANLVFRAATDPEAAGTDIERIRERLRLAGVLADGDPLPGRTPDPARVARAGGHAATGRALADYVADDRGET